MLWARVGRRATTASFPLQGASASIFSEPGGHQNVTGALTAKIRLIYEITETRKQLYEDGHIVSKTHIKQYLHQGTKTQM